MGESQKTLQDYLLSKHQIETGQFPRSEIYLVQYNSKTLGPFWQGDLKEFLDLANLFSEETSVKAIDDKDWKPLFQHPLFQRRRPSLVSQNVTSDQDNYFILIEGQSKGPYKSNDIIELLDKKELLYGDYISIDNGTSWGKIFEVEEFNRRNLSHSNLPTAPEDHIFKNSIYDADTALIKAQSVAGEKDALVGLAYVGHLNEGKKKQYIDPSLTSTNEGGVSFLKTLFVSAFIFGAIFFAYSQFSSNDSRVKLLKNKNEKIKVQRKYSKRTSRAKRRSRKPASVSPRKNLKVKRGRTVTRSSDSIRDAQFLNKPRKMVEGKIQTVDVPPEAIFDDNTDAVELDPIRERVSKETIDPENDLDYNTEDLSPEELEELSQNLDRIDENGNPLDSELDENF